MSEKEISLGRLFVQEAIKAGIWGLIFLMIMGIFITSIKQDIKEGIAFGVDRFMTHVAFYATDLNLLRKTKELIEEGTEFSKTEAAKKILEILEEESKEKKAKR